MTIDPRDIVDYLRQEAGRPLKAKELARAFGVAHADYAEFKALLQQLESDGVLYRVQRQRYAAPERINLIVGRMQTTRSGAGFLIPEDGSADIFIPVERLNTALDGDRVVGRLERRRGRDRPEGSVVRVLERARTTVVGTFRPLRPGRDGNDAHGFVIPEDRKLPWDVFVAPGAAGEAEDGDLVVVRITHWGSEHRGPTGEVEEVLGRLGDPGVDVLAIIRGHELPTAFPPDVEREGAELSERGITAAELVGREDLRDRLIFTIDPVDAKDHDDALSIETMPDGGWRVGIHIADVSHYVTAGSALDREAVQRGTSVYLVDRVVPMLPHALSSGICSLVPDEDRLTLSLFVDLDAAGDVRAHRLVRAVIRSRHKLAYERAQAVLDGAESIDGETDETLRRLRDVARLLRAARMRRGSLDFDLPEARVVLNSSGEPTDIQRVLRLESHRIIEDFMLLANEVVARKAARAEVPFVYRIHEAPDSSRMDQLREFVATFGHRLRGTATPAPKDLQRLLIGAAGRPEEGLISTVVLRSMKQARYSEQNLGHFGLAARTYTHFTSPIRRYPDLIVHRILTTVFLAKREARLSEQYLADVARSSSERERVAVAAERDSKDLKKVEFMQRHLGDEFEGTISSVTAFGFFVLLDDYFVDGLVHVSALSDDYYLFAEEQYALIGERTRRRFRTGDRVRVSVAAVDLEERRIDFQLVEDAQPARPPRARRGGRPRGRRGTGARRR